MLDTAPTGHTLLLLDAAQSERLQTDLRRAEIEPFGWVINASLLAGGTTHPTLRARAAGEFTHIEHVQRASARGTWLVGWQPDAPVGAAALRELATGATVARR